MGSDESGEGGGENRFEFVGNTLGKIDPIQYAAINEVLENYRANVRVGPPVDNVGNVVNPNRCKQTGIYMRRNEKPDNASPIVMPLEDAIGRLTAELASKAQLVERNHNNK